MASALPQRPWIQMGLDKLRAGEPCESRDALVKKKETQVNTANLQLRS